MELFNKTGNWIPAFAGMTALFPNYDTVSQGGCPIANAALMFIHFSSVGRLLAPGSFPRLPRLP
jgi:hypothetical protein